MAQEETNGHCGRTIQEVEEEIKWLTDSCSPHEEGWRIIFSNMNIRVWRRRVVPRNAYEYKVYGQFDDVSADDFFECNVNLGYRREWDDSVLKLEEVDRQDEDNTVIRWVMKFPYPLSTREYVYHRRIRVLSGHTGDKLYVVGSRSVEDFGVVSGESVHVNDYRSEMIILSAGSSSRELGVRFVFTYFDDPKLSLPDFTLQPLIIQGIVQMMSKMHSAAKGLRAL